MKVLNELYHNKIVKKEVFIYDNLVTDMQSALSKFQKLFSLEERANDEGDMYEVPERFGYGLHKNVSKEGLSANIEKWKTNLSWYEKLVIELFCSKYIKWISKLK